MLHSSELGMAGRCLQIMQLSRMRLWWREVKVQSVFWFYSLQDSHLVERGILFCMSETLHLLPCAIRQVPLSVLVPTEFWSVQSVNPLQMWYNSHLFKSEVRWLTSAAPCWRVARISDRHHLSLACEQRIKFLRSLGSLMKISTYMLIIFIIINKNIIIIITEWLKPFRLQWTG